MPASSQQNGTCASCGKSMPIRLDGNIRTHGPVSSRCPGSGIPPCHASAKPPALRDRPSLPSSAAERSPIKSASINPGRSRVRTLKRVPRASRDLVARKLAEILDNVTSLNDIASWERLFLFSRRCLHVPHRGGHRRSLATLVNRAVQNEVDIEPQEAPKHHISDPLKNLAARVATKLEEGDFRGAVKIASSNESFAPVDETTLNLLKEKHPPQHPGSVIPTSSQLQKASDPLIIGKPQVLSAIQSFPTGSASGPDGLRPQHIKDLILNPTGGGSEHLIHSLTNFVNLVVNGEVPAPARPFFFGASLVALNKNDGGVRPIAVGCTLRRLASKCAALSIREEMGALLPPLQLGYGTPMGAEAAVHATRTFLHNIQPGHLSLKVDFCNAFNSIRRDKMLSAVLQYAPSIFPLIHSPYSQPTSLFFGNDIIDSAEGVQQGDPLGPLLFSLTIHELVCSLKSTFRLFYLDDGTLGGQREDIVQDLHTLEGASDHLGLVLNHSKSEVICSDPHSRNYLLAVSPDFQIVPPANASLLGSPIGDIQAIDSVLSTKMEALKCMGQRLSLLHSHDALCLLRNAFTLPKLLYVLRTSPCFQSSLLLALDNLQRALLESICNVHLSDQAWTQASLPIKRGGLGIRSFTMLAPSAFLASAAGSYQITTRILPPSMTNTECPFKMSALATWQEGHSATPPTGSDATAQKKWDTPRITATIESLLSTADHRSKCRLLASQRVESGAWLNAPPISAMGLRMQDETIRIAIGLCLGVPVCFPHTCIRCKAHVDDSGIHGLSCHGSTGRHPRHTALNDIVKRALAAINIPTLLEPPGLFRSDGRRVDGVTILPWKNGRALVWDATCRDTFAPAYASIACKEAGLVAKRAEDLKHQKYAEIADTYHFIPVAVETTGVFGPETMSFLKELGRLTRIKTRDPTSFQKICQHISVSIQNLILCAF